jgi:hypothetical protein
MTYDPSTRGTATVGVRTIVLRDENRGGRTVEVEIWYPAEKAHRDQDMVPAPRTGFR